MRVGDLALGRAGDKGSALDLTVVAVDDEGFRKLSTALTAEVIAACFEGVCPATTVRHEVAGLRAIKFVLPDALPDGVYGSLRAGMHWQKTAINRVLDLEL